ncbi:MAG: FecR family protein [Bacteroidales bacterium]
MKFNIPWSLFRKLLRNGLSPNEKRELEYWRDSSVLNQNIYDEIMDDELVKIAILNNKWENNSMEWSKILSRIHQPAKRFSFSRQRFIFLSSAASILFFFSIISSLYFYSRQNSLKNEQPEGYTYIYSPRGQRTRVVLPDKTKVWLNSESSLKYSTQFNSKVREVIAQGEAFFEVQHNPEKPFYVLANEIKVKVYGTSFNIKAFPNENTIETTLIEGKLSITSTVQKGKEPQEIFLKPNEKCIIIRDAKNVEVTTSDQSLPEQKPDMKHFQSTQVKDFVVQKNINTEEEKLWKDGKLVFRDRPFGELAVDLERWFDVKIHFKDERIKNYKFTGVFEKETINQAMEALKLSSQKSYHYEISFRDIYLKSK